MLNNLKNIFDHKMITSNSFNLFSNLIQVYGTTSKVHRTYLETNLSYYQTKTYLH